MPKTTTHYVVVLARQAQRLGLDINTILEQCNIPLEMAKQKHEWIDNRLLTNLMKHLWQQSGCETWQMGEHTTRLGTWSLACEYMLNAETLGDLYRKAEHIFNYLPANCLGIHTQIQNDTVTVCLSSYTSKQDPNHFLAEFLTLLWHRFASWAINECIALQETNFNYPAPEHAYFYDELFHCPINFEKNQISLSFNKRYLQKKIARNKSELGQWLHDSPADLMYLPGRERSVRSHIKSQLFRQLDKTMRFPSFERICCTLTMSPQVVRRRLAEEGSSYQQIKDCIRQQLSIKLLANQDLLLTEIADRTGFTEAAAFSRAFKKWTGMSPAHYRENKFELSM